MTEIILPSTFLLEDDGVTTWGYVRAQVEMNTVVRIELALKPDPTEPPRWVPFASLTVVQGRIAYHIHSREDEIGNADIIRDASGKLHIVLTADEKRRRVEIARIEEDGELTEPPSDNPALQHGEVGQDARDQTAAEGSNVDPGDRDR